MKYRYYVVLKSEEKNEFGEYLGKSLYSEISSAKDPKNDGSDISLFNKNSNLIIKKIEIKNLPLFTRDKRKVLEQNNEIIFEELADNQIGDDFGFIKNFGDYKEKGYLPNHKNFDEKKSQFYCLIRISNHYGFIKTIDNKKFQNRKLIDEILFDRNNSEIYSHQKTESGDSIFRRVEYEYRYIYNGDPREFFNVEVSKNKEIDAKKFFKLENGKLEINSSPLCPDINLNLKSFSKDSSVNI
jgi:hypothetical protein